MKKTGDPLERMPVRFDGNGGAGCHSSSQSPTSHNNNNNSNSSLLLGLDKDDPEDIDIDEDDDDEGPAVAVVAAAAAAANSRNGLHHEEMGDSSLGQEDEELDLGQNEDEELNEDENDDEEDGPIEEDDDHLEEDEPDYPHHHPPGHHLDGCIESNDGQESFDQNEHQEMVKRSSRRRGAKSKKRGHLSSSPTGSSSHSSTRNSPTGISALVKRLGGPNGSAAAIAAGLIKPVKPTLMGPPLLAHSKQLGVTRSLLYNGARFAGHQKSKGSFTTITTHSHSVLFTCIPSFPLCNNDLSLVHFQLFSFTMSP